MTEKLTLLSGTAAKTEKGFFYIKNGVRVRIPNKKVLKSWRFGKVVKTTEDALAHYPVLGVLGFRDGTLLWCIADGRYYIISDGKRVHVDSPQTLSDHKLAFKDAYIVSRAERDLHKEVSK